MIILNIRRGFATNSSSSHSIIFTGDGSPLLGEDDYIDNENYCLKSKTSKKKYISNWNIPKKLRLKYNIPEKIENEEESDENDFLIKYNGFCGDFPKNFEGKTNILFIEEFIEWILSDSVGIFSKYDDRDKIYFVDNEHNSNEINGSLFCLTWPTIAKKDKISGDWVVFNKDTGYKCRFNFKKNILGLS